MDVYNIPGITNFFGSLVPSFEIYGSDVYCGTGSLLGKSPWSVPIETGLVNLYE